MNDLRVFETSRSLKEALQLERGLGKVIGFVPTMGALHEGHMALVQRAYSETDIVVVSIFVNPTQFNNHADLEKYPRMLEKDLELLESVGRIWVFAPSYEEVYPETDSFDPMDLEGLEEVLEGTFRPGHFQGVVHVVRNLFHIVEPNKAFFGLKDFQQVAIIRLMVNKLNLPVEIVPCATLRESTGLAMSSRNLRLTDSQREEALIIFRTLEFLRSLGRKIPPSEAKEAAISFFKEGSLELEYLEIVDGSTLKTLITDWGNEPVCCIAAFCGEVRLIDNMQL